MTPTISELIHHIKQCPTGFIGLPMQKGCGEVATEALVNDALRAITGSLTAPRLVEIDADRRSENELRLMQVCCWLMTHPSFSGTSCEKLQKFLLTGLGDVAEVVNTEAWISDEERAEELARLLLAAIDKIPANESAAEARDRLDSVNTVQRRKVIEESRAAIERTRELRRKMAEAKAREAANVYGRE